MASLSLPPEEALFCPVCHDMYKDPVVLSCLHSFCEGCLYTCWKEFPMKACPLCDGSASAREPTANMRSPNHKAAQCQKEELQKSQKPLDDVKGNQSASGLKSQTWHSEWEITEEYLRLRKIVHVEHEAGIAALRDVQRRVSEAKIEALSRQIAALADTGAAEKALEAHDLSFLQDYKATVERAQRSVSQDPPLPSGWQTDGTKHLGDQNHCVVQIGQYLRSPRSGSTDHCGVCTLKSGLRKYACELTLDPNTAHRILSLSEGNRKATWVEEEQLYPNHPERFDSHYQVLCREGLKRRSYWEVEWEGQVNIGVTYRGIQRRGVSGDCYLGSNDESWILFCYKDGYTARHGEKETVKRLPHSSTSNRVGVYLDWPAGCLSFYRVASDTLIHIHTFHCCFTEPLHPGFGLWRFGSSVFLCQMEEMV